MHAGSRADELSVRKVGRSEDADVDVEDLEKNSSEDDDEKNSRLFDFSLQSESIPEKD